MFTRALCNHVVPTSGMSPKGYKGPSRESSLLTRVNKTPEKKWGRCATPTPERKTGTTPRVAADASTQTPLVNHRCPARLGA